MLPDIGCRAGQAVDQPGIPGDLFRGARRTAGAAAFEPSSAAEPLPELPAGDLDHEPGCQVDRPLDRLFAESGFKKIQALILEIIQLMPHVLLRF